MAKSPESRSMAYKPFRVGIVFAMSSLAVTGAVEGQSHFDQNHTTVVSSDEAASLGRLSGRSSKFVIQSCSVGLPASFLASGNECLEPRVVIADMFDGASMLVAAQPPPAQPEYRQAVAKTKAALAEVTTPKASTSVPTTVPRYSQPKHQPPSSASPPTPAIILPPPNDWRLQIMEAAGIPASDFFYVNGIQGPESGWCATRWQGYYGPCLSTFQPTHSIDAPVG